jgi:hypothetical protein
MTTNLGEDDLRALIGERRKSAAARRKRRELQALRRRAEVKSVRFPVGTLATLVARARDDGLSVNALIARAVRNELGLDSD